MRELEEILAHHRASQESMVLGTLVDLRGSGYRRPGARVLLQASGERVGMISGGCLEREVTRQAWALTEAGRALAMYDTRADELHPLGRYGTGCDGIVTLLLERLPATDRLDALSFLTDLFDAGAGHVAMATITSAPTRDLLGARVILDHTGALHHDEDFPGELTARVGEELNETLARDARPESVRIEAHDITLLVEVFSPPRDLLIFGDGDDLIPLVEMAAMMGWRPRLVGKWPARATKARFPRAHQITWMESPTLEIQGVAIHKATHVLLATHDLEWDARLLPELLESEAYHIDILGSRHRAMNLMRALSARGALPSPAQLDRVDTPAGLDLGGDRPEEVALSILAAMVARSHARAGGLLSRGEGAIHAPHARRTLEAGALDKKEAS